MSFGILQTFCIFISVAVFYAYVYQLFFYTAVITLGGRREMAGRNAYFPCLRARITKVRSERISKAHFKNHI
jgi:hypothetical protein